jgi:hypothetical protein
VKKKCTSTPSMETKTTKRTGHSTHREGGQIKYPEDGEKKRSSEILGIQEGENFHYEDLWESN